MWRPRPIPGTHRHPRGLPARSTRPLPPGSSPWHPTLGSLLLSPDEAVPGCREELVREGAPAFLSLFQPRVSACGRLPSSSEVAVSILLARQEQSEAGWGRPVLQGDQRPSGRKAAYSPWGPCFPACRGGLGFQKAPLANSSALSRAERIYKVVWQNWGSTQLVTCLRGHTVLSSPACGDSRRKNQFLKLKIAPPTPWEGCAGQPRAHAKVDVTPGPSGPWGMGAIRASPLDPRQSPLVLRSGLVPEAALPSHPGSL